MPLLKTNDFPIQKSPTAKVGLATKAWQASCEARARLKSETVTVIRIIYSGPIDPCHATGRSRHGQPSKTLQIAPDGRRLLH